MKFQQVNYKSISLLKGLISIISFLQHYLENYCQGVNILYFHAENCVSRNKNNDVFNLNRGILTGRKDTINFGCMIAGITKFAYKVCMQRLLWSCEKSN